MSAGDIAELERRLGHRFQDREMIVREVTHPSYAAAHPGAEHHEALAFVGEAALGLVVAEHVFGAEPGAAVGRLTPLRAEVVADEALARWGGELELGALLPLGRGGGEEGGGGARGGGGGGWGGAPWPGGGGGAEQEGGRETASILATTLEAVL